MAPVVHYRLTLVFDAVFLVDHDLPVLVSRIRKAKGPDVALRFVVRSDGSCWLEQQQQDSSGSTWWPVCPLPVLAAPVSVGRDGVTVVWDGFEEVQS